MTTKPDTSRELRTGLAAVLVTFCAATAVALDILPFDDDYKPLSFVTASGEPDGFDVAVAKAIADRMGISVDFRSASFSVIKSGDWPADWAFAVSSMTPSPERAEKFDFVGPYYYDAIVVVAHGDDPSTLDQVRDTRIGIGAGYIYDQLVAGTYQATDGSVPRDFGQSTVISFSSETEMLVRLADPIQDEIDFAITSVLRADLLMELGMPLKRVGNEFLIVMPVSIAVPKTRPDLLSRVETAFEELKREGVLADLSTQYLGADYTALGAATD